MVDTAVDLDTASGASSNENAAHLKLFSQFNQNFRHISQPSNNSQRFASRSSPVVVGAPNQRHNSGSYLANRNIDEIRSVSSLTSPPFVEKSDLFQSLNMMMLSGLCIITHWHAQTSISNSFSFDQDAA